MPHKAPRVYACSMISKIQNSLPSLTFLYYTIMKWIRNNPAKAETTIVLKCLKKGFTIPKMMKNKLSLAEHKPLDLGYIQLVYSY